MARDLSFKKRLARATILTQLRKDDAAADLYNLVKEDKLQCLREDAEVKVSCVYYLHFIIF